jgi:hypothetical protein
VSREDTSGGSEDPLSEEDARMLAAVRAMWEVVDPMPPDLVQRVRLAVELESIGESVDAVDLELARPVELPELAGARSDEHTRLVTFQGDNLTIMITVEQCVDGTTRIDGWLSPAACHRIELRCPAGERSTESDDAGRFSLDGVPAGAVRFIVHDAMSAHRVITPTIEI